MNEDLAAKILGAMKKAYTGEQTVRWLANLNDDLTVVNKGKPTTPSPSQDLSVRSITILDRLFDDFQRYCFEFNKTVTDIEFRVQCERPKPINLQMPYREEPIICQGHISTTVWAMIVQAQESTVSVFIVPIDFLLGFHAERANYQPHMTMHAVKNSLGALTWQIDGVIVQTSMLPTISKKLFAALIRVFNGEVEYTTKFQMIKDNNPIPTTTTEMIARPAGYHDQGFELLKPSMPPNMNLGQAVRDQQAAIEAVKASGAAPGYSPQQLAAAQAAAQAAAAARAVAPAPAAPVAPGSPEEALMHSAFGLEASIDVFQKALDKGMEELTALSVKAMQNQDIVFAQRSVKRSAALKQFRDQAANFLNEWRAACKE
jgi:hypothetical protein